MMCVPCMSSSAHLCTFLFKSEKYKFYWLKEIYQVFIIIQRVQVPYARG